MEEVMSFFYLFTSFHTNQDINDQWLSLYGTPVDWKTSLSNVHSQRIGPVQLGEFSSSAVRHFSMEFLREPNGVNTLSKNPNVLFFLNVNELGQHEHDVRKGL